jgi:hypothetical protein
MEVIFAETCYHKSMLKLNIKYGKMFLLQLQHTYLKR